MVTIGEKTSKRTGELYQYVENVSPVSKKLKGDCPDPKDVEIPGGKKYGRDEDEDALPPQKKMDKAGEDELEDDPF